MSIKFKSKLSEIDVDGKIVQSKHRVIKHTDTVQDLVVTVITKTAAHPEFGNGSSSGFVIDGVEGAYLEFTPGITYKFDQSDSSNANHPLRFYEDAAKATAYTTGVTTSGTPGSAGAYTQIIPTTSTPPVLFYQCSAHSLMGSYVKFGTGTVGDTYSLNATTNGVNVDLNLDAASGTDSAVQLTSGQNIVLTRNSGTQVTIDAEDYELQSVQDGSNVDLNLTSGTGNDNSTVQLTAGSNVTLTSSNNEVTIAASAGLSGITVEEEAGPLSTLATALNFVGDGVTASGTGSTKTITIPGGSGGGSGTVTIEKNISGTSPTEATNGTRTAFTITSAPENENDLQVYIDGVYQSKDTYTTSGTTVTFNAGNAPPNSTEVEFIHIKAVSGIITVDTFTGDGTTTFNLTLSNANENHTQIYLDGVYQSKENYSIVGKVITFTTAPPTGAAIEVVHLKAVDTSSLNINTFTGNGTTTDFTLSESIEDENKTFVFVQGVYQEKSNYSISGTTLSFLTAPPNGFSIEVMAVGTVSFATVSNANDAKYTPNLISSATTAVAGNLYVFTSSATLTLPASPSNGDTVKISNRSNTETCVVARNSSKIMGLAEDMTIDTAFASFELIYSGSTQGWVII